MNQAKISEMLEQHKKWLLGKDDGKRADLRYADLSNADLSNANLRGADLSNANLSNADLSNANLRYANLRYADLRGADLSNANLRYANLRYADLRYADLSNANLSNADLRGASHEFIACPELGEFIGFKKCRNDKIVKLLILEDALRLSATKRKCRASKVKVLDIYDICDSSVKFEEAVSQHDLNFIYKLGEIVEVEGFDPNRWNECSTGIHFFLTEKEAKRW